MNPRVYAAREVCPLTYVGDIPPNPRVYAAREVCPLTLFKLYHIMQEIIRFYRGYSSYKKELTYNYTWFFNY
ncbi:MAG: hypothetical protein AB1420_16380 [Bacillota bacterium]